MDTGSLLLFLGVDALLVCTPGPDWLVIVARGLGQGRRAALRAVAGIATGYALYTVLAAVGLAAAIGAVPGVLPSLRYAGAAYLVWLAFGLLRGALSRGAGSASGLRAVAGAAGPGVVWRQSLLTALLNPKALLLYVALLPQFVEPGAGLPVGVQTAVLGTLHVVLCVIGYGVVALGAARARVAVAGRGRVEKGLGVVSGVLLLAVAGVAAGAR
ncbi:LysE family translocator [Streptomyces sp. NPDC051940]|uniref:LysE family translocator n=1 Tax=Streptomyces sp. NPDC051940 TaxID=3155675 RepID=UPI003429EFA7